MNKYLDMTDEERANDPDYKFDFLSETVAGRDPRVTLLDPNFVPCSEYKPTLAESMTAMEILLTRRDGKDLK